MPVPMLWYTSRSPIDTGQRRCAMERYLGYHAGPHGTGYRRVHQSIPLATGSGVHQGIELIGQWVMEWQERHGLVTPPDDNTLIEVVAWAASEAARRYESHARQTGFVELVEESQRPILERTILEQRTLIEGQVWAWAILQLTNLLADHYILGVETEEVIVLDCSCGLGSGVIDLAAHRERKCEGIVLQGRPDMLIARRTTHEPIYVQIKTKAQPQSAWEKAWEHDATLLIDMEAASRRLGKSVNHAFIHVLYKGWRGRDRGEPPDSPKVQHSVLCYGYHQAAVPPMREAGWAAEYWSTDEMGKRHSLPKTYEKVPIWDESIPMIGGRPDATRVEVWVREYLGSSTWPGLLSILGPFERVVNSRRLDLGMKGIIAEELVWQQYVNTIRDEHLKASPDQVIPRSWNCTNYDGTPCPFKPVCDGEITNPADSGRYTIRTPHHQPEKDAFVAEGVVFPASEDEEEEGDEDNG